jgi:hypothetical protein
MFRISYDDDCNQAFPMVVLTLEPGKRLCASRDGSPFVCERVHGSDICRPMYAFPMPDWHGAITKWLDDPVHIKHLSGADEYGRYDLRWHAAKIAALRTRIDCEIRVPPVGARVLVQRSHIDGSGYFVVRLDKQGRAAYTFTTHCPKSAMKEAHFQSATFCVPLYNRLDRIQYGEAIGTMG